MTGWQNSPFAIDVKQGDKLALCMCGKSANGPYCDGTHKDTKITPNVVTFDEDKTIYICGCAQSAKRPYCDGSHSKL